MSEAENFFKLCTQFKVPVDKSILRSFEHAGITGELIISGLTIGVKYCEIIAQVLHSSKNIVYFNASDCLLPPNGLVHVIGTLQMMKTVQEVNFHGNNISSDTTSMLGSFLSHSKCVKVLILKWNNLGLTLDTFFNFCDGLSANDSLETLDLRCNQICSEGAKYLANSLRTNKRLKYLDLRWNKIENSGAEVFLQTLEENKNLSVIKINGNLVKKELNISLDQCLKHNTSVKRLQEEWTTRTSTLTKYIKLLEEQRNRQVDELNAKTQKRIEEAEEKLRVLMENLGSKEILLRKLEEELSASQSSLKLEQERCVILEKTLQERNVSHREYITSSQSSLEAAKKIQQEKDLEFIKYQSEIEGKLLIEKEHRQKAEDELRIQTVTASNLKLEVAKLKEQLESSIKNYNETLEAERDMWQRKCVENEKTFETSLQRARTATLDKQQVLENTIMELTEKQSSKLLILSERVDRANEEKQMFEAQIAAAHSTIVQLQRENATLIAEVTESTRKLSILQAELSEEKILNQKLKQQIAESSKDVDTLKLEIEKLTKTLAAEKHESFEQIDKCKEETRAVKVKLKQLQSKVEEKERQIENFRSEERERAKVLYSAFNRYMDNMQSPRKLHTPQDSAT